MANLETLNKIKEALLHLEDSKKIDYWITKFQKELKGYVQRIHGLYHWKPFLYRIRKHCSKDQKLIKSKDYSFFQHSEMFWCPKNQTSSRANLPFERRLYLASTVATAMSECCIRDGDEFTLVKICPRNKSSWYGSKPVLLGFTEYKKNYFEFYKMEQKVNKENGILAQFLSESFIEDRNDSKYCFTQYIASIMFKIPEMKCIIYPSTKNHSGYNLVYKADVAETELKFEWAKVCYCKGENKYDILYEYELLAQPPF